MTREEIRKVAQSVGVGMYRAAKLLSQGGVAITSFQYENISIEIGKVLEREFSQLLDYRDTREFFYECLDDSRTAYWLLFNQGDDRGDMIQGVADEDRQIPHELSRPARTTVARTSTGPTFWNVSGSIPSVTDRLSGPNVPSGMNIFGNRRSGTATWSPPSIFFDESVNQAENE